MQQEVIQQRQQEKKQMLESVKKYRKGTVLGALGNAMFLSSIVVMVVIMILQRVVLPQIQQLAPN